MIPFGRQVLWLEWLAFAAMVVDHASRYDIWIVPGWEIVGRLAFPLFAFTFSANAVRYGRCNVIKLVLLGVLAAPGMTYLAPLGHWWQANVLFTFPAGWTLYRYFATPQHGVDLWRTPLLLSILAAWLSLSPAYGVGGMVVVASLCGMWHTTNRRVAIGLALLGYGAFAMSLANIPTAIAVAALLAAILWSARLLPSGGTSRARTTWWQKAGFGKWYICQAYGLGLLKLMGAR